MTNVKQTDRDAISTFFNVGTTHLRVMHESGTPTRVMMWCQAQGWKEIATFERTRLPDPDSVAPSKRDDAATAIDEFIMSCAVRAHKILFEKVW